MSVCRLVCWSVCRNFLNFHVPYSLEHLILFITFWKFLDRHTNQPMRCNERTDTRARREAMLPTSFELIYLIDSFLQLIFLCERRRAGETPEEQIALSHFAALSPFLFAIWYTTLYCVADLEDYTLIHTINSTKFVYILKHISIYIFRFNELRIITLHTNKLILFFKMRIMVIILFAL